MGSNPGSVLERAGEEDAVVLAEHFEGGGEPGRAVALYLRAAEEALEGHDVARARHRATTNQGEGEEEREQR